MSILDKYVEHIVNPYIEKLDRFSRTQYIYIVKEQDNNSLVKKDGFYEEYIVAMHYGKSNKKPMWKVVWYDSEDGSPMINSDIWYTNLSGWNVLWEKRTLNYYGIVEPTDNIVDCRFSRRPNMFFIKSFIDVKIPYYVDYETYNVSRLEYIRMYKQHKEIEMLVKMGIGYLWNSKNLWKAKDKKPILKWIRDNFEYVKKEHPSIQDIKCAINNNIGWEKLSYNKKINHFIRYSYNGYDLSKEEKIRLYNASLDNNFDIAKENSYLWHCKAIGKNYHQALIPRDIDKSLKDVEDAYHILQAEIQEQKRLEKENERLEREKNNNEWISTIKMENGISYNGYEYFVPSKIKDFVSVGNIMSNCVGTYPKKVENKSCYVVVVCKDGHLVECCELQKRDDSIDIIQLRGYQNQETEYHNECKDAINYYINVSNNLASFYA